MIYEKENKKLHPTIRCVKIFCTLKRRFRAAASRIYNLRRIATPHFCVGMKGIIFHFLWGGDLAFSLFGLACCVSVREREERLCVSRGLNKTPLCCGSDEGVVAHAMAFEWASSISRLLLRRCVIHTCAERGVVALEFSRRGYFTACCGALHKTPALCA